MSKKTMPVTIDLEQLEFLRGRSEFPLSELSESIGKSEREDKCLLACVEIGWLFRGTDKSAEIIMCEIGAKYGKDVGGVAMKMWEKFKILRFGS